MPDQAEELRRLARAHFASPAAAAGRGAHVLAITSGKGGVGKSHLAVNLALAVADLGRRVLLMDMDLGLANADVLLNLSASTNLSHVLAGRRSLQDVVVRTDRIRFLPGASGIERLANLGEAERQQFLVEMDGLTRETDLLILDTGAGISRNVLGVAGAADRALVVTTPEPTALVDAYAVIKLLSRCPRPPALALVVNQAAHRPEADRVGQGIVSVARRLLGASVTYLGAIPQDAAVREAARRRVPFLRGDPTSQAACAVQNLARAILPPLPVGGDRREGFVRRVLASLSSRPALEVPA